MTNDFAAWLSDDIRATAPRLLADAIDPTTGDFSPEIYADQVDWDGDLEQLIDEENAS